MEALSSGAILVRCINIHTLVRESLCTAPRWLQTLGPPFPSSAARLLTTAVATVRDTVHQLFSMFLSSQVPLGPFSTTMAKRGHAVPTAVMAKRLKVEPVEEDEEDEDGNGYNSSDADSEAPPTEPASTPVKTKVQAQGPAIKSEGTSPGPGSASKKKKLVCALCMQTNTNNKDCK
jgi:hypothetical protein